MSRNEKKGHDEKHSQRKKWSGARRNCRTGDDGLGPFSAGDHKAARYQDP